MLRQALLAPVIKAGEGFIQVVLVCRCHLHGASASSHSDALVVFISRFYLFMLARPTDADGEAKGTVGIRRSGGPSRMQVGAIP